MKEMFSNLYFYRYFAKLLNISSFDVESVILRHFRLTKIHLKMSIVLWIQNLVKAYIYMAERSPGMLIIQGSIKSVNTSHMNTSHIKCLLPLSSSFAGNTAPQSLV
jgi:hypothetical protein